MSAATAGRAVLGLAAIAFGIMTILSGGKVLFGDVAARAEAGHIVSFVLVFNFCAGFVYVATGLLTLLARRRSITLARVLAVATVLIFVGLGVHIATDGAFELRTVKAMTVRSVFWIVQAAALQYLFGRSKVLVGP